MTHDKFMDLWRFSIVKGDSNTLWQAIEADREAIRAEVRQEVPKDHFKPGEILEVETAPGKWTKCVVEVRGPGKELVFGKVRRPPKIRTMTREEKIQKLRENIRTDRWLLNELKEATIDDLCQAFDIKTEVADE